MRVELKININLKNETLNRKRGKRTKTKIATFLLCEPSWRNELYLVAVALSPYKCFCNCCFFIILHRVLSSINN